MTRAELKGLLLLIAEWMTLFLFILGVIKIFVDIPIVTQTILDFRDPHVFEAWVWSPIGFAVNLILTPLLFWAHRKLVTNRQQEYRTRMGIEG